MSLSKLNAKRAENLYKLRRFLDLSEIWRESKTKIGADFETNSFVTTYGDDYYYLYCCSSYLFH